MSNQINITILLDLWKHFSEDAAKIKDKLWTIVSWLYTLMGAVLAFIVKGFEPDSFAFAEPKLAAVLAFVGAALVIYTYYMITEYGEHIRTAWNRTDYLRTQIDGLEEIWESGYPPSDDEDDDDEQERKKEDENGIPKFAKRIRLLCVLYGVAFLMVFILAIIY